MYPDNMTPINLISGMEVLGIAKCVSNENCQCDPLDKSALGKVLPN